MTLVRPEIRSIEVRNMKEETLRNLFPSCSLPDAEISLRLYCDESACENWLYIAMLLLPEEDENWLLQQLLNARCGERSRPGNWAECKSPCPYHHRNNARIHWSQLRATAKDKAALAHRWLDLFLNDISCGRAYILGIDLARLDQNYFGNERTEDNIYNRFFRTALLKATKSFFPRYKSIRVTEIIHDQSTAKETHQFFDWQPIFRVNEQDDKVFVEKSSISFLNSDHRESNQYHSHFLQYIDFVVNCFRQALDGESQDPLKVELGKKVSPLLRRLLEKPNNVNSRYNYVGRLKIEFFPKHNIASLKPESYLYHLKRWDCFYTNRTLKLVEKDQGLLFA